VTNSPKEWTGALPGWVPLAQLLDTVEKQLGIPPEMSRDVLRSSLETMKIATRVIGWEEVPHGDDREWQWVVDGLPFTPGGYRVWHEGWEHICWKEGTLVGCEVRVLWDHVLSRLQKAREEIERANQAPVKGKGGRPPSPKLDEFWIEVAIFAGLNGLNEQADRTRLQKRMEDWAVRASEDSDKPVYSAETIRDKLRALYGKANAGN
jgi:hypothetical protein